MWFDQLTSFATAVSALAVVVSAIYAAIQIRQNTRAVSASAFQEVINSFARISFDIAKDKELVGLYLKAGRDFSALGEIERAQYSLMLLSFLRRAENVLFQSSTHVLASDHWSDLQQHHGNSRTSRRTRVLEGNRGSIQSGIPRVRRYTACGRGSRLSERGLVQCGQFP